MMTPRYDIYALTTDGRHVRLFRWCRSAQTGIDRARHEMRMFRIIHVVDVWAEPLHYG